MSKLPKYTLKHNAKKERWDLVENKTDKLKKSFGTKAEATKSGVLEKAVGEAGGSVRIEKEKGGYQEERTYPRSADPKSSKG